MHDSAGINWIFSWSFVHFATECRLCIWTPSLCPLAWCFGGEGWQVNCVVPPTTTPWAIRWAPHYMASITQSGTGNPSMRSCSRGLSPLSLAHPPLHSLTSSQPPSLLSHPSACGLALSWLVPLCSASPTGKCTSCLHCGMSSPCLTLCPSAIFSDHLTCGNAIPVYLHCRGKTCNRVIVEAV